MASRIALLFFLQNLTALESSQALSCSRAGKTPRSCRSSLSRNVAQKKLAEIRGDGFLVSVACCTLCMHVYIHDMGGSKMETSIIHPPPTLKGGGCLNQKRSHQVPDVPQMGEVHDLVERRMVKVLEYYTRCLKKITAVTTVVHLVFKDKY